MNHASDFGFSIQDQLPKSDDETVLAGSFQGFVITKSPDGFYWAHGGYFDTVEECRADIDYWNALEENPPDDPSLESPWWSAL